MPGAVHLLIFAILLAPVATAAPLASVAVGPDGPAAPGEPYYLRADASAPEGPRAAEREDDCAAEERPASLSASLYRTTDPLVAWDPRADPRLSTWFPECMAIMLPLAPAPFYAAYDVESGRYFVQVPLGLAIPVLPGGGLAQQSGGITGTTGVGLFADCEACPPPDLG